MLPSDPNFRSTLVAGGWRQGSIITLDRMPGSLKEACEQHGQCTHWVIISQDCDLLHFSLDKEPHCELLGSKVVAIRSGEFARAKNPRRTQFEAFAAGKSIFLEANVHDRLVINRELIAECAPDGGIVLSSETTRVLINWIARRYIRSAFPDAFNERIRKAETGVKKLLFEHGDPVSGIWIYLNSTDELAEDEPYEIEMKVSMTTTDYEIVEKRDGAQKLANGLEMAFGSCPNVSVISAPVVSEAEISIADLNYLLRWDGFDYLSNSE